ncbi:MAG TPA: ABC transporter ATP-binding protein, partial [Polyangiaceae bacterium LLY-WYZ-15_(1-7)]|nr:ABC transporter ATP-binding protein [Polyangiaceae bacterium LLY-WYZ-15_(1-7)]
MSERVDEARAPAPAVRARGLTVRRGARAVLEDVELEAARGEVLALLGPNGAGKSTLLRALAGLLPLAEGHLELAGGPLAAMAPRERARALAYVPQRSLLRSALLVEEVVAQGRYAHGRALGGLQGRDAEAVDRALAEVDALAFRGRAFPRLSVGEQQRVLLARALATEAPLLLLDEPTAPLDIAQALATFDLLRRLADAGRAVVAAVHGLDAARQFADRALLLHAGRVAASGPVEEVVAPEPVRRVYGVELLEGAAL